MNSANFLFVETIGEEIFLNNLGCTIKFAEYGENEFNAGLSYQKSGYHIDSDSEWLN